MAKSWDLGRFWQTLTFFEAIPFVSDLQRMISGSSPAPTPHIQDGLIFDFRHADLEGPLWGALDDVVMGGVSQSQWSQTANGGIFAGQTSTANSGGFASIRTRNFSPELDLSAYHGLTLRVRGDGQRYKFFVRDATSWDSLAYASAFGTQPQANGIWQTVQIPFAGLVPVFRAKVVKEAPPLNCRRIYSFQLMLSKFEWDGVLNPAFQPGPFALEVESLGVYGQSAASV